MMANPFTHPLIKNLGSIQPSLSDPPFIPMLSEVVLKKKGRSGQGRP
jgi:hypothetical protein